MGLKGVASKGKGKAVADTESSGGKRKRASEGKGNPTGGRRRIDRRVLRFFEDAADESESDGSDIGDDFKDDAAEPGPKVTSEPRNSANNPFVAKEEVIDEEEFDKIMEKRYNNSSKYFSYAEYFENKSSTGDELVFPSEKDPIIWKVKCVAGREKHLAFCLMQKFVDLKLIGTSLPIISAFTIEHVKGFLFMEADKKSDVIGACIGINGLYATRVMAVPCNEVSRLFSIRTEYNVVSVDMWVRMKNGVYKGDLGKVVAVNETRKRATVKLIPRIDLLELTEKLVSGQTSKKRTSTPAARLISASELEEFRPLIQSRQDRECGMFFEVLNGMLIKDGFIFKKIAIDSLSCWGVVPSEEERLKFETPQNHESENMEWLSQLYGEENKKIPQKEVLPEKGESSSVPTAKKSFEVHDFVCFGRKDFGIIVGMEKDDSSYKILKEGVEGPMTVSHKERELKHGPSNMRFTASDHKMKAICANDTVRVVEGSSEGKQGIVKLIYRGVIFLYDENEEENGGYFCCKARLCEKIKNYASSSREKGMESDGMVFEEFPASPKSPLSPEKTFQARESNRDFNRAPEGSIYTIGQMLRIRVGPLKGYLCRVLAIRRFDITVKLDSKQKVLTVKSEHLAEVQKKNPITSSDDPESTTFKPFDMTGGNGSSSDWMSGAGASDGWNAGAASGGSSWGNAAAKPSGSNDGAKIDVDDGWGSKVSSKENTVSWGAQGADADNAGWSKSSDAGEKSTEGNWAVTTGASENAWDKGKGTTANLGSGWGNAPAEKNKDDTWGKEKESLVNTEEIWEKGRKEDDSGSWGKISNVKPSENAWDKGKKATDNSAGGWGSKTTEKNDDSWGKEKESSVNTEETWGKGKQVDGSGSWGQVSRVKSSENAWGKGTNTTDSPASGWGSKTTEKKDDPWGKKTESSVNTEETWGKSKQVDGSGSWAQVSRVKPSENAWGKGTNAIDNETSGWGSKTTENKKGDTWGKEKDCSVNIDETWGQGKQVDDSGSWDKVSQVKPSENAWGKGKTTDNSASGWGSAGTEKMKDDTWGRKPGFDASVDGFNINAVHPQSSCDTGKQKPSGDGSSWGKPSDTQDDGWGKRSAGNSVSGGNWSNQDSAWGKKSSEPGIGGGDQGSTWGKKSSGGVGGDQGSTWGKKSWNTESGNGNQNSNWGGKSDWISGSSFNSNRSFQAGNDDQGETFSDRSSGGGWRGGRGSYRGRRGNGDQGGEGRGFGGRGGFRGRGDRGGYGGRDGEGRGFRGRGDRGGSGGRGRGRRDESGGWNNSGGNGSRWNTGNNSSSDGWKGNNANSGGDGSSGGWGSNSKPLGGWKGSETTDGNWGGATKTGGSNGGWSQGNNGNSGGSGSNGGGWGSDSKPSGGWKGSEMTGGNWGGSTKTGGSNGGWSKGNNENSGGNGLSGGGWGSNSKPSGGWKGSGSSGEQAGGGWCDNGKSSSGSEGGGGWGNNGKSSGGSEGQSSQGGGGGWESSTRSSSGGGWNKTAGDSKDGDGASDLWAKPAGGGGKGGW